MAYTTRISVDGREAGTATATTSATATPSPWDVVGTAPPAIQYDGQVIAGDPESPIRAAFRATAPASVESFHQRETGSGTVSTSGTTVTGTNTSFQSDVAVGQGLVIDGQARRIASITSDTELTLDAALASDVTGKSYTILPRLMSGTVTTDSGDAHQINGTDTSFTSEIEVGDLLLDAADASVLGEVTAITDDTTLTLDATTSLSGAYVAAQPPYDFAHTPSGAVRFAHDPREFSIQTDRYRATDSITHPDNWARGSSDVGRALFERADTPLTINLPGLGADVTKTALNVTRTGVDDFQQLISLDVTGDDAGTGDLAYAQWIVNKGAPGQAAGPVIDEQGNVGVGMSTDAVPFGASLAVGTDLALDDGGGTGVRLVAGNHNMTLFQQDVGGTRADLNVATVDASGNVSGADGTFSGTLDATTWDLDLEEVADVPTYPTSGTRYQALTYDKDLGVLGWDTFVDTLADLTDVSTSSVADDDVLAYDPGLAQPWTNVTRSDLLQTITQGTLTEPGAPSPNLLATVDYVGTQVVTALGGLSDVDDNVNTNADVGSLFVLDGDNTEWDALPFEDGAGNAPQDGMVLTVDTANSNNLSWKLPSGSGYSWTLKADGATTTSVDSGETVTLASDAMITTALSGTDNRTVNIGHDLAPEAGSTGQRLAATDSTAFADETYLGQTQSPSGNDYRKFIQDLHFDGRGHVEDFSVSLLQSGTGITITDGGSNVVQINNAITNLEQLQNVDNGAGGVDYSLLFWDPNSTDGGTFPAGRWNDSAAPSAQGQALTYTGSGLAWQIPDQIDLTLAGDNNPNVDLADGSTLEIRGKSGSGITTYTGGIAGGTVLLEIDRTFDAPWTEDTSTTPDSVYVNGPNVGIGTVSPTEALHVAGDVRALGWYIDVFEMQQVQGGALLWRDTDAGQDIMAISESEVEFSVDVGIGTGSPSEALQVVGNIAVSGTVDGYDIATTLSDYNSHKVNNSNPHSTSFSNLGGTPDQAITAGNNLQWSGSTLNVTGIAQTLQQLNDTDITNLVDGSLMYWNSGAGDFQFTAGGQQDKFLTVDANGEPVWKIVPGRTNESIRDLVAGFVQGGTNIAVTHDDAGDTLTVALDGTLATGSLPATVTYTDQAETITATWTFNSDINVGGDVDWAYSSDRALKRDVLALSNVQQALRDVNGIQFTWKSEALFEGTEYGIVAQDLEEYFPHAIRDRKDGSLAINPRALNGIVMAGLHEHQTEIDQLKERVAQLEAELDQLRS